MDFSDEHDRLTEAFGRLRLKLLDLSKKNRMLNYGLGSRSKRHLQMVDEVIDEIYIRLVIDEVPLRIDALEEPKDTPAEEKTEEFAAAFDHAKASNIEYLTKLEALESSGRDDESELIKLERELRDRVRETLGLPARPRRAEINRAEHARSIGIEPNFALGPIKTKLSHGDAALQTLKFPDELDRIMGKLVADARLSEQEMGISTLFLAFGFLEWYESDVSDKKAFAPLLLLPVRVEVRKQYGKNVYSLVASEEAAETNLSLQKLLETNAAFHRKLPLFKTEEDEGAASIENYFTAVKEAIRGLNRWQIHRWMVLGHFAFGRFAVYSDLNPENWSQDPVDHSLVGAILRGTENTGDDGTLMLGDPSDYQIDEAQFETVAPFLIQDADASQHSALIDAMKGHNLVIQGPPGTGKSQTISNIIANALALDKTVLFVAEMQAALEVVKRRLERADLGRFCLELHSEKASPKAVLESLTERLKMSPVSAPIDAGRSLHENRAEIGKYLQALHAVQPGGKTTFDLIWKSIRELAVSQESAEVFTGTKLPDGLLRDSERLVEAEERLARFAEASDNFEKAFGHPTDSPWASAGLSDIGRGHAEDLLTTLHEFAAAAGYLSSCLQANAFGVRSLSALNEAFRVASEIKSPPPDAVGAISHLDQNQLCKHLENRRSLREAEQELARYPTFGNRTRNPHPSPGRKLDLDRPAADGRCDRTRRRSRFRDHHRRYEARLRGGILQLRPKRAPPSQ